MEKVHKALERVGIIATLYLAYVVVVPEAHTTYEYEGGKVAHATWKAKVFGRSVSFDVPRLLIRQPKARL